MHNPDIPWSSMHLVKRSDTSRSIYPRAAFMTVFALHLIWRLLSEGSYYKDHGFLPVKYSMFDRLKFRLFFTYLVAL